MDAFLKHYGLGEQPFGVTPDPRFLYLGPKHREALASLIYGTEANCGFLALIAKPGMGKTSLLFRYLEYLHNKARTAFVFQTDCDSREFLRHVLFDFGLDGSGNDLAAMHEMLNGLLTKEMRAGRRVVLVIDEAQNLGEKVLESVRLLSNFETPWKKLLQIVLAGQPQLAGRLAQASLAQLKQRISLLVRIEPLTPEETGAYIGHRLRYAGYRGPSLFTADAQLLVARYSEGIPRNINNICFNAMSLACALNQNAIGRDIINEVLHDLDLESLSDNAAVGPQPEQDAKPAVIQNPAPERKAFWSWNWLPRLAGATAVLLTLAWPVAQVNEKEPQAATGSLPIMPLRLSPPSTNTTGSTIPPPLTAPGSDSVRVMPGQTLYEISVANLGEYNGKVLRELRKLNPWLIDPDYVQAGLKLKIPTSNTTEHALFASRQSAQTAAQKPEAP